MPPSTGTQNRHESTECSSTLEEPEKPSESLPRVQLLNSLEPVSVLHGDKLLSKHVGEAGLLGIVLT